MALPFRSHRCSCLHFHLAFLDANHLRLFCIGVYNCLNVAPGDTLIVYQHDTVAHLSEIVIGTDLFGAWLRMT